MEPSCPTQKLAGARNHFLDSLDSAREEFADHEGFIRYWTTVEEVAQHSEDLGQLERWVKDLRGDRERVAILVERKQAQASHDMQAAQLLALLQRILAIIDDLYDQIRKRHRELHDRVAWWMLLAPAGKKSKPLPKGLGDTDKKPKGGKKEGTVRAQNLSKNKQKKKPTKQKAP